MPEGKGERLKEEIIRALNELREAMRKAKRRERKGEHEKKDTFHN